MLYSGDRLLPANILFDESMRQALAASSAGPIGYFSEFLDEGQFPANWEDRTRDLVLQKYGADPADAIVAVGAHGLQFCIRHRAQLFADTPIVFAGLDRDSLGRAAPPGLTGVRGSVDEAATVQMALRLHPRTRQIYLITGPGGREPAQPVPGADPWPSRIRIPVRDLSQPSLPKLLQALSTLPANSLVFDVSGAGSWDEDGAASHDAVHSMSAASRAPLYGLVDPLIGHGLVGAVTTPMDEAGRAAASLVLKVLSRPDPGRLPPVEVLQARPLFDWRQLQRWNLHKNQLPPGSVVRFEPPSFWRQHLLLVVTTSVLFLLQSALILSLVLQSRRRRRAEIEVRRRREELAHMTRVATISELTASLAHEINQPLAAILSNAQAAQRLLVGPGDHAAEIREILSDIAADDQRAGEVIRRMRTLLRKGEFSPANVDVNELVDEVAGLVRGEMILQNVSLSLELAPRRLPVHGDRVQLQQVLLNLVVNALDAMKETSGGNRRVVVRTAATVGNRSIEVSVRDSGVGIPADGPERIFEPLYTTKPHGLGLGLAICRSIIQAHGGRIGFRNNPDRGATVWFTLPVLNESRS